MESTGASPSDSGPAPYLHLTERAVQYVLDRGGSVAEEALIAYVFGSAGTPALWQPLLHQILIQEQRLVLRPDGRWSVRDVAPKPTASPLTHFVAIDVETTGLHAVKQRVIELALVRFRDGKPAERFSSLLNPDRRIPKFITDLTHITNDDVADAPRFPDLAGSVLEFVEGALLVGHTVGFDIGFINAELGRAGRPPLINERLDVMGLAVRLLPGVRRPSLDKVAIELGLSPRKVHRAEIDAELAGKVALHLAARASDLGIDSLERLRGMGKPFERGAARPVGRASSLMDRGMLAGIPKRPGVYMMRDAHDRIIYVGKAKNLKDRVSSYFSQPLGYTRKMDGLLESIARIEVTETGSELGALLLESQLIRRLQPRYNVVMRAAEEYPLIRVDLANPWPRITVAKARKQDGAAYFGPFKSRKAVRLAIELLNEHYPLRTCTRSFKDARSYGSPCIQLDLGRCLGPCAGRADRDEYMAAVRDVIAFLDGDSELLFTRLWERLEACSTTLDFERARKLRNSLQLLQGLVSAHRQLREADDRHGILLVQPGPDATREVRLIARGQVWSSHLVQPRTSSADLAERLMQSWRRFTHVGVATVDHLSLDDVVIVNRWLAKTGDHPCVIDVPDQADVDWEALADRILSLDDADLVVRTVSSDDLSDERETRDDEVEAPEERVAEDVVLSELSRQPDATAAN